MKTRRCKVKPDREFCHMCIETQEMCDIVENCSKCEINNMEYELLSINDSFWSGTYALVNYNGKLKKASIDRIVII